MSKSLIEKIKKAREQRVDAGGYSFTIRRPTDMDMLTLRNQAPTQGDIMHRYVTGWSGVLENHVVPGGSSDQVPFDSDLFIEWVSDRPELWRPLTDAIMQSYEAHFKEVADKLGEQDAG